MAAPSKLTSHTVMYLLMDSHVKPQSVKILMQMRAGRKGYKNKKRWSLTIHFCFGQELVKREAEVSLKGQ